MRPLKIAFALTTFGLLTILTQVGGLVYLSSFFLYKLTDRWTKNRVLQTSYRLVGFLVWYGLITWLIVPLAAKPFGRVPLPWSVTNHLQPLNFWTCALNRHYVSPALKQAAFEVTQQMNAKFPGTTINYLDANFPFIDKFPLLPHLSHDDGKKLDLSFCYRDARSGELTNASPSFIGYGICEEPRPDENNTASWCAGKGYWQYSLLTKVVAQNHKPHFLFDPNRTRALVNLFAAQPAIGKIFIEPHLKTRLQLTSNKVRFHGCQAVRHDDHIHVQLR